MLLRAGFNQYYKINLLNYATITINSQIFRHLTPDTRHPKPAVHLPQPESRSSSPHYSITPTVFSKNIVASTATGRPSLTIIGFVSDGAGLADSHNSIGHDIDQEPGRQHAALHHQRHIAGHEAFFQIAGSTNEKT